MESLAHTQPQALEATAVVEQLTRGEVDMQVATAKRYPRSVEAFKQDALSLATLTPAVAGSCFYKLPRSGKTIEGPSARLAEIVATTWGNLRCETRIVSTEGTLLTAQATCWDMQRNVLIRAEVQRRITDRSGRRFSDDMIVVTGNAAMSIALRNAIFKVVPRAYVDVILEQCQRVAVGGGGLVENRSKWLGYFGKQGYSPEQLCALLDVPSVDDMGFSELATLQGIYTAVSEGDTTLEQVFRDTQKTIEGTKAFGFQKNGKASAKPKSEKPAAERPAE